MSGDVAEPRRAAGMGSLSGGSVGGGVDCWGPVIIYTEDDTLDCGTVLVGVSLHGA